jgi:hypothetical protein
MFNSFFNGTVYEINVEKSGRGRQATGNNKAHDFCALDN